ncbi:MAG TPA: succinate dehydrogenase assembly factor 4 [Methylocella sp.]
MQRLKDETGGLAVAGAGHGEPGQAARRALAEAEERRRRGALNHHAAAKEINGRDGPEPVRYGDWEVRGIVSDF